MYCLVHGLDLRPREGTGRNVYPFDSETFHFVELGSGCGPRFVYGHWGAGHGTGKGRV